MKIKKGFLHDLNYRFQALILDFVVCRLFKATLTTRKKVAQLLVKIGYDAFGFRKKQVIDALVTHLAIPISEAKKIARKTYFTFLFNSFEMASLKHISADELNAKIRVSGLQYIKEAAQKKSGIIIVSGHFGLWELVPSWLTQNGYNVNIVVRRQNNPYVDEWMEDMRQRLGPVTTDSGYGIRKILRSLKNKEILALMVDQDNGKQGIFVDFLNMPASAPTGPAQIGLKTGAPIVPLFCIPNYSGKHLIKILPPIYPQEFPSDVEGQRQITHAYTKILEFYVKKHPHQWFWIHRRWKTQPHDAPHNLWAQNYSDYIIKNPKIG